MTDRAKSNTSKQGLRYHELCEKFFDPIEGPEFDELVADIKANGLRDKIVLHDRAIIDGRNRYRRSWNWRRASAAPPTI